MIQGWKVYMVFAERNSSEVSQVSQRASKTVFKSNSVNKYLDLKKLLIFILIKMAL